MVQKALRPLEPHWVCGQEYVFYRLSLRLISKKAILSTYGKLLAVAYHQIFFYFGRKGMFFHLGDVLWLEIGSKFFRKNRSTISFKTGRFDDIDLAFIISRVRQHQAL